MLVCAVWQLVTCRSRSWWRAEAQAISEDLLHDMCLADLIVYVVRLCLNSLALWCTLCNTGVSPATCRSIWQ